MKARIKRVVFEADVHRNKSRFQVPAGVARLLGVPKHGPIALLIKNKSGKRLYAGKLPMASRFEVYGLEMNKRIKPGQTILVKASRP